MEGEICRVQSADGKAGAGRCCAQTLSEFVAAVEVGEEGG